MTSASPKYGEGVLSIEQRMLAAKAYQRAAIENFGPFVRSEQ